MLSHVDPIEKIWMCLEQVAVSDEQKPDIYMDLCDIYVDLCDIYEFQLYNYICDAK